MKAKPENWNMLGVDRQMEHMEGNGTGVCWCNSSLDESCDKCKDLPDLEPKDRNFHEEAIIIAKVLSRISRKDDDAYWMYKCFLELDDTESFNRNIMHYFYEEGLEFDEAFARYHKLMRQVDYYDHLSIKNTKADKNDEEKYFVSTGNIDSLLHSFIRISDVPYKVLKKLMSL